MAEQPKILVVDDEAVITGAAEKILRAEGFRVRGTADAEMALTMFRVDPPDIALVDLMLPGLSGLELLNIVRREYPQTVVIMMTGYSMLDNAIVFLKCGAFDFIPKPFTFEEMLSAVQRAGRFIALRAADRRVGSEAASPHRYQLGISSWAKADQDGTALLGITNLFGQLVGRISRVELPSVNDEVRQGGPLAQVVAQDEMRHTAWSALSGRIIAVNHFAQEIREPPNGDPLGDSWLVRIIPDNLESEMMNLSIERSR
ncbi:MAG: response regulator [Acidobacteriota bacterium]|jgi:FixJ family two-component response regulator